VRNWTYNPLKMDTGNIQLYNKVFFRSSIQTHKSQLHSNNISETMKDTKIYAFVNSFGDYINGSRKKVYEDILLFLTPGLNDE
jgi:hypothetical protein